MSQLRCLPWLLLVLLAACASQAKLPGGSGQTVAQQAAPAFVPTETAFPVPSPAFSPASPVAPELPESTPFPSETAPCDPQIAFCLHPYQPRLAWPLPQEANHQIAHNYRYGQTQNGHREPHHGLDFPNPFGTPVLAAAEGRVLFAGSDKRTLLSPWPAFYGNLIVLEHFLPGLDSPLYTLYGHLSAVHVQQGQMVRKGQAIGEIGMSGVAIGSHLHFEVRLGGIDYTDTRNPELWLPLADMEGGLLIARLQDQRERLLHITLNIQAYPPDGNMPAWSQPIETYDLNERWPVNPDERWQENLTYFLPPGKYRLAFVRSGQLVERWFEIQRGKITYLVITAP